MVREYWAVTHHLALARTLSLLRVNTPIRIAAAVAAAIAVAGIAIAFNSLEFGGKGVVAKLIVFAAMAAVPALYLYTLACLPAQMAAEDRALREDISRRLSRRHEIEACLIRLSDRLVLLMQLKKEIILKQAQFDDWVMRHNEVLEGTYMEIAAGISHTAANAFLSPPQLPSRSPRGYFNEQHGELRRRMDIYIDRLAHLIQGHYSSLATAWQPEARDESSSQPRSADSIGIREVGSILAA